jgi:ABC-type amino acid transport substrate-binding protein
MIISLTSCDNAGDTQLNQVLSSVIQKLIQSGELQQLHNKYHIKLDIPSCDAEVQFPANPTGSFQQLLGSGKITFCSHVTTELPYSDGSKGLEYDLADLIVARMIEQYDILDFSYRMRVVPLYNGGEYWSAMSTDLYASKCDAIIAPMVITSERLQALSPTTCAYSNGTLAYITYNKPQYSSYDALNQQGISIGIMINGYGAIDSFTELLPNTLKVIYPVISDAYKDVKSGEVDAFVTYSAAATQFVQTQCTTNATCPWEVHNIDVNQRLPLYTRVFKPEVSISGSSVVSRVNNSVVLIWIVCVMILSLETILL